MKKQQDLNKKSALMSYLECELKTSRTLEEFQSKFAEIKAIVELSDKKADDIAVAEKLDWSEYDSVLLRNVCEKTTQIMHEVEALNDFWMEIICRFVTKEGAAETGRPLMETEKQALYDLLTKNRVAPIKASGKQAQKGSS